MRQRSAAKSAQGKRDARQRHLAAEIEAGDTAGETGLVRRVAQPVMKELVDGLGPALGRGRRVQRGQVDLAHPAVEFRLQPQQIRDVMLVAGALDVEAGGGELAVAAEGVEQDLVAGLPRHHRRHVDRQAGALQKLGAVVFLDGAFLALFLVELEEEAAAVGGVHQPVERIEAAPVGRDGHRDDVEAEVVGDETGDDTLRLASTPLRDQPAGERRRRGTVAGGGHAGRPLSGNDMTMRRPWSSQNPLPPASRLRPCSSTDE